jgi:hypothetical protein
MEKGWGWGRECGLNKSDKESGMIRANKDRWMDWVERREKGGRQ